MRVSQAPTEDVVANNAICAVDQINRTLADAAGALIPNRAGTGPETGGAFAADTLNFEKDFSQVDIIDFAGLPEQNVLATFFPVGFPGIPGSDGTTEKFALEAVAFLQWSAGEHTFGVSTTTERTDINDDDAYQVFVARNPRDFFGLKVAE